MLNNGVRVNVAGKSRWKFCKHYKMKHNLPKAGTIQTSPVERAAEFVRLGTGQIAYIKEIHIGDVTVFSLIAADGTRLGLAPCRKAAVEKLMQVDLEVTSLH